MTETKAVAVETAEKKEVTVSWHKMTDGIGLVFAGVLSMLEALDAGTARDIMNFVNQGSVGKKEGEANDAEDTGAGTVDGDAGADDAPVADTASSVEEQKTEPAAQKEQETTSSVTQDDITKIIVQKLKKDRSNNEKIGAILKTYGVAKVSELPAEKYEAFLTDLSQL